MPQYATDRSYSKNRQMRKPIKAIALLIISLMLLSAFTSCGGEYELEITVFDDKNGKASVLRSRGKTLVLDCGNDSGTEVTEKLITENVGMVDVLIISSFAPEFFEGAARIIENFEVKSIYIPDYTPKAEAYESFMSLCDEQAIEPYIVEGSISFGIGDASVRVYAPVSSDSGEESELCLMTRVVCDDASFLFTSNAGETRISEFMQYDKNEYDLISISADSDCAASVKELITESAPDHAIISTQLTDTVKLLKDNDCEIYYPEKGTLQISCDGDDIEITQK